MVARLSSSPNHCSVKFETFFVPLQVQLRKVGTGKKNTLYSNPSSHLLPFSPLLQWSFAATVVSDCSDCPRARCADVAFALNAVHASLSNLFQAEHIRVIGVCRKYLL